MSLSDKKIHLYSQLTLEDILHSISNSHLDHRTIFEFIVRLEKETADYDLLESLAKHFTEELQKSNNQDISDK